MEPVQLDRVVRVKEQAEILLGALTDIEKDERRHSEFNGQSRADKLRATANVENIIGAIAGLDVVCMNLDKLIDDERSLKK